VSFFIAFALLLATKGTGTCVDKTESEKSGGVKKDCILPQ